jgi:hypothetical protein
MGMTTAHTAATNRGFQVTAMYMDAEIGYGEGDTYEYASQEAAESVGEMYPADEVKLVCTSKVNGLAVEVSTPLDIFRMFAASGEVEA